MALYPRNNTSLTAGNAGIQTGPSSVGTNTGTGSTGGSLRSLNPADNPFSLQNVDPRGYDFFQRHSPIDGGLAGNLPTVPGRTPEIPGNTPTTDNGNTLTNPGGYYPTEPSRPDYSAPTLPGANSQADYINAMYDANRRAQEDSLRNAYQQQVNVLNDQANRLPAAYNAAADQVAAQAAIQQRNFNEQAASSGLNTGAGSQARLAQNNAYLGNIRQVRQAQADAEANLNLQRAQLETQYRNAIADAIAQNDLQRAQALYQEAVRVDESITNTAINQANMDWQVWNALYNK